jgi:hypothetical protein
MFSDPLPSNGHDADQIENISCNTFSIPASSRLLPAHSGSSLADFSTMKMEAIRFSETSVPCTGSTRRHIPEDGILHSHRCENRKSYNLLDYWSAGTPWQRMVKSRKKTIVKSLCELYSIRLVFECWMDLSIMTSTSPSPPTTVKILTRLTQHPTCQNSIKIASPNGSGFNIVCSGHIIRCVSWTSANKS